jgi:SAM-dependent methyltransferase
VPDRTLHISTNIPKRWDRFAAREPYFAVIPHPAYLRHNLTSDVEADFFFRGQEHVNHIFEVIRQRIDPDFAPRTALEFGCGPGRMVVPISGQVPEVTAVDVSPAMLAAAAAAAARNSRSNIVFQTLGEFLASGRSFDFIHAYLVFQHIPPRHGLIFLRELLERLSQGGIGIFQFAYRRRSPRPVALARWLRTFVPGLNAAANLIRGRPWTNPFLNPRVHDLGKIFPLFHEAGCTRPHAEFARHADLDVVLFYAQKGASAIRAAAPAPEEKRPADFIDVRERIAGASIPELNAAAEGYYARLPNWDYQIAKPLSSIHDIPAILINFATLVQGLRLAPGLTALDFGAGGGWLSRWMTQMGCRMILLDVAPTALRIAQETYRRLPPVGATPPPAFLTFDGRIIPLADESVDRIICFDAFHHAANPPQILAEFARILKRGGIAAFAEPGPDHSKTAASQFEMRNFGMIENDIDMAEIWTAARAAGFTDLKLAGFNARPFHMRLAEYDDLLAGGETLGWWTRYTRESMGVVRDFFLFKDAGNFAESREFDGLAVALRAELTVKRDETQALVGVRVQLTNIGRAMWLPSSVGIGGVWVGCHLYDGDGRLLDFNFHTQALPGAVPPGGQTEVIYDLPPLPPGSYQLEFDLVAEQVIWFSQAGSSTVRLPLRIDGRP